MGSDISYKDARIFAANLVSGIRNSVLASLDININDASKTSQESGSYHLHPANSSRIAIPNRSGSCKVARNMLYSDNSTGTGYELFKPVVDGIRSLPNELQSNSTHQRYQDDFRSISAHDVQSEVEMEEKNGDGSDIKYGKRCPKCYEINEKDANWCMECGKAIISVEIRRCDSFEDSKNYLTNFQHQGNRVPCKDGSSSTSTTLLNSFGNLNVHTNGFVPSNPSRNVHVNLANPSQHQASDFQRNFHSEDFHVSDKDDERNAAVYMRTRNDEKTQELPFLYAFDDLLYPNHAMDDPIMGYVLPSSTIVSNSGTPFFLQSYEGNWILNAPEGKQTERPSSGINRKHKKWRNKKKGKIILKTAPIPADEKERHVIETQLDEEKERRVNMLTSSSPSCCLNLPEEIILKIFSFLTMHNLASCARVCRQFGRIVADESLWKSISLKKKHKINDEILKKIARRHPSSLSITHCNMKHITMVGVEHLFRTCNQSLEVLDISGSSGGGVFCGETVLLHASTRCHNIQSLDVSWSNVGNEGLQAICGASSRLVRLSLNGCQRITDDSIKVVTDKHCDSLQVLELFGCFNVTPVAINLIASKCNHLQVLNLGQCHKVTNPSLCNIARGLPKLRSLDIRGCKQIRDPSLREIIANCHLLSDLVIANCPSLTDSTLMALASLRPKLRCLDVCGVGKITDRGVQALSRACRNLRSLDLSSTKATARSVIALSKNCREELESLKLSFCHAITIDCLYGLVLRCKKLKTLHLYGCRPLPSFSKLVEMNPNLNIEKESLR